MLISILSISLLLGVFNPIESINVRKTFHGLSSISDSVNYQVKFYQQKVYSNIFFGFWLTFF